MIAVMESDGQSSEGKARSAAGNGLRAVCASKGAVDPATPGAAFGAGKLVHVGKAAARVVDKAKALSRMKTGRSNPLPGLDGQSEHTDRRNRMRMLTLLAVLVGLALPAQAQDLDTVKALAAKLKAHAAMAADRPAGGPQTQPMAIADVGPAKAVRAGWNSFKMSVCIAGIYEGNQFIAALATTGESMVTQSTYALGVVAANCASGKTFWAYLESDLTTISAIGSYPP